MTNKLPEETSLEKQNNKPFLINMRRDSGELRLLITVVFSLTAIFFLWAGYKLASSGASGKWEVVASFTGWKLYLSSISPGLLVILLGAVIMTWGIPRTFKSL